MVAVKLGIVVPFRNRSVTVLESVISVLCAQKEKEDTICLVDYGSDLRTRNYLENLNKLYDIEIIYRTMSHPNVSYARNVGGYIAIRQKKTHLFFCDADILIPEDYLDKLREKLAQGNYVIWPPVSRYNGEHIGHGLGCCSLSVESFQEIKGWDENWEGSGEDADFIVRSNRLADTTDHRLDMIATHIDHPRTDNVYSIHERKS